MKTMKYLVICVFAACTTFGLVQSNEELDTEQPDGPFSCPTCTARGIGGEDADLTACDDNIRNVTCPRENSVCMLGKLFHESQVEVIKRHCYSRNGYNRVKDDCDANPSECAVAMCDKSGCKAELITTNSSNLEELDKEQPDGPFSCPVCQVKANPGKDADTACDENIRNEICPGEDPVCMLFKRFSGSQVEFIDRHCFSREDYDRVKGYCDKPGKNCALAMCDNSGCKAELITTNAGIEELDTEKPDGPFSCPTCLARGIGGEDADLTACDDNIRNVTCRSENSVCMLGKVFHGSQVEVINVIVTAGKVTTV
ncbi:hypothetical protein OS493_030926 [Desmophyllum pertusum]|uniref:Sodefrin-like factor n=1 Tax=Desmophyllum pertusum TaxID=174260 RepID=A0A9W9ZX76_9CNID|nr:hypothetical protein OS493_030926 [Desmophyllum pertusum]